MLQPSIPVPSCCTRGPHHSKWNLWNYSTYKGIWQASFALYHVTETKGTRSQVMDLKTSLGNEWRRVLPGGYFLYCPSPCGQLAAVTLQQPMPVSFLVISTCTYVMPVRCAKITSAVKLHGYTVHQQCWTLLLPTDAHNVKNTELLKHSKITLQHVSVYIETIFRELKSVLG